MRYTGFSCWGTLLAMITMFGYPCFTVSVLRTLRERDFFSDNLLVRIHFSNVMIRWTGLAPWELEFPFSR